jgi:hypothetical protein
MIASQKIGKSFMGALSYNLKKMHHPDPKQRAKLLATNFTSLDKEQVRREVELVRELRPNLNRYVYHTSLNFPKEDQLQNTELLNIAIHYLEANGFTNNQYFIFRHHDAEHPHLHLLVNRISFDGNVVSDSNNYKKSEQVLRCIELQYNLVQVKGSESSRLHAATKDELEMVIRTGRPSEKMLLQEIIKKLLNEKNLMTAEFIRKGEQQNINFLFNQASTGRVTGITYFHNGFKIKGQALGNSFKWAEIIKKINYGQIRDRQAIGEANSRTRAVYGNLTTGEKERVEQRDNGNGSAGLYTGDTESTGFHKQQQTNPESAGAGNEAGRERTLEAGQDADILVNGAPDFSYNRFDAINIEISDDEDDANYRRRKRGR